MENNNEVRQTIIVAAKELFSRFGLAKTTMEDIATASKKAKSTLYYYFRSKEEVFTSVIMQEIFGLKSAINKAIQNEDDPYYKLRKFVITRLEYLSKKADQYTSIREEYLKNHEFIRETLDDYSKWEISTIKDIIEYGREKGLFEVTDSVGISKALFFALKGLEYPWTVNFSKKELEKSAETLLDILLKGISRQ
jgi:AcrR family transcriptional regulator